jgi:4-carboxymuconolactone decarboxylase
MPPIPADRLTPAQRTVAETISAGPRGRVSGPFIPALRSPELASRLQHLGEYLRYDSSLAPKLRELVILLTAREWTQHFEWDVHAPLALKHGLRRDVIQAIAEGRRPAAMRPDEALVHDFCTELARNRIVGDATYERAVARLGEQGVVDLVGTAGYYATLAMLMNVARTPLPRGRTRAMRQFPTGD